MGKNNRYQDYALIHLLQGLLHDQLFLPLFLKLDSEKRKEANRLYTKMHQLLSANKPRNLAGCDKTNQLLKQLQACVQTWEETFSISLLLNFANVLINEKWLDFKTTFGNGDWKNLNNTIVGFMDLLDKAFNYKEADADIKRAEEMALDIERALKKGKK